MTAGLATVDVVFIGTASYSVAGPLDTGLSLLGPRLSDLIDLVTDGLAR